MARSLAALAFVALALTTSAGASTQRDALIRPGVGIGKIRLGMTLAQVRAAWGRPQAQTIETLARVGRTIELQYDFAAYTVTLTGRPRGERVVAVGTMLAKERLRQGVGVGSLERRVRRVLRGELRCGPLPVSVDARGVPLQLIGAGSRRRCTLGDRGGRHTVFTSGIQLRYPWDARPVTEWVKLARVMEILVRGPGAPPLPGE
jgi:hypothetical protein